MWTITPQWHAIVSLIEPEELLREVKEFNLDFFGVADIDFIAALRVVTAAGSDLLEYFV